MGAVVQFRRKSKYWSPIQRPKSRSFDAGLLLPLGLLLGIAAIIYAVAEFRAHTTSAVLRSHSQESFASSNSGRGDAFSLCDGARRVNCVVDGDTIWYNGSKVRIADIDAPEIHKPKCASELALGERAKYRLLALMNAGPFDVVRAGDRDHDKYGRELRIIARGGRSITETMVAEGLVRRWDGSRHPWCG